MGPAIWNLRQFTSRDIYRYMRGAVSHSSLGSQIFTGTFLYFLFYNAGRNCISRLAKLPAADLLIACERSGFGGSRLELGHVAGISDAGPSWEILHGIGGCVWKWGFFLMARFEQGPFYEAFSDFYCSFATQLFARHWEWTECFFFLPTQKCVCCF